MEECKKYEGKGFWICGCLAALFYLVGFVFYVILFVNKIGTGDWITNFFLIYGLVGFILTFIIFTAISTKACVSTRYMYETCEEDCECGCPYDDFEEDKRKEYEKFEDANKKGNENE